MPGEMLDSSLALASASRSIGVGPARRIPDSGLVARGFDSRRPQTPVFLGCFGGGERQEIA
jgi:hypothetical protein